MNLGGREKHGAVLASVALASIFGVVIFSGCGGVQRREILSEYRLSRPRAELGHSIWLASFAASELAGSLSPDGRRLLYTSDDKGSLDIWIKNLVTGLPKRLTTNAAIDTQPAFFPDGQRIVFVSMRKDAKGDLYLWAKGKISRLTGDDLAESDPTVASDGAIYYAAGDVLRTRIVRLRVGEKTPTPVSRWGATHPALSADGRLLAFTWFDPEGRGRVVVKRLADARTFIVTMPDYHAGFPTFSPKGR
ncbi:MAG: PD40 domain-containing protein, partial [Deltaproteobacteria bacterium]|nr:PD40 domain-containing protein [Deltaproteobacteria bacterium]